MDRRAVLCAAMGMTEEEGSLALGVSRQRYKGALQRARRRLARELGDGWV
ncbi:MAG: hypothetical protein N2109_12765 [Fimbriimonadales bacterium]|nr:hypothetical protein [Fimbriimonadales bacterium]